MKNDEGERRRRRRRRRMEKKKKMCWGKGKKREAGA